MSMYRRTPQEEYHFSVRMSLVGGNVSKLTIIISFKRQYFNFGVKPRFQFILDLLPKFHVLLRCLFLVTLRR